ncbi:hypothetical protein PPTG_11872 [Phytophthora nicotianae INRA-310]|uniref:Uncharacterized protein n=1 Tax=Phytophthora nicotianae (strain INRA-310) TaxID=761204 RepID=W2QAB2_PHYN3|nr:hypothetical protein PPTG_11872 [Phytophthora nicotianae INRA-310]ETN09484.1 hypothetical protein PPTG_11872 [Phytophthora nicotianae INRA-310]
MPTEPKHGLAARTRVLDARNAGRDWMLVAECNDIPATTARGIVNRGTPEVKQRGGSRAACVNTPEMEAALVEYIEENCLYTLAQMQEMLHFDFGVRISTSLIRKKLCDKMYTMKHVHVRVELETCNSAQNIKKRKDFADSLLAHERNGSFIVYYGETNYNIYCKRSQGRALIGERAVVKLPPSKVQTYSCNARFHPKWG